MRKMVRVPLLLLALVVVLVAIEALLARLARDAALIFPPAHSAALHGGAPLIQRGGGQAAPVGVLIQVCGDLEDMTAMAKREWGEEPVFHAISDEGQEIHVLVSRRGHWTELVGPVGGPVCIVKQGAAWGTRLTRAQ